MAKIVFMGTPEFAVPSLEALARAHEVISVYSQPDKPSGRGLGVLAPPVKRKALELGLEVLQPAKLADPSETARLRAMAPDLIAVVAYGKILRPDVLAIPRLGCVNLHSSLLPRWRGAAPIQRAILAGDAETGVTTMRIVEELDAGDILLQKSTPIGPGDTAGTVHDRLAAIGAELLAETVSRLETGLQGRPQDPSKVTYAEKLTKEMEAVDFTRSAREIDLQVRALNPWPGVSVTTEEGERLMIRAAKPRRDIAGGTGTLFDRAGMVLLGTSEGALELLTLQWEGKRALNAAEFLNGLKGRGRSLPIRLRGRG